MNDWMTSNPGKTVTIYNVAQFSKDAFYAAFNMKNVTSGFKNTGICPLNKNIFTDEDFLPSFVTDRPQSPQNVTGSAGISNKVSTDNEDLMDNFSQDESTTNVEEPQPGSSNTVELQTGSINSGELQPGPSISNEPPPGSSNTEVTHSGALNPSRLAITLEQIRPYPKAPPRKTTGKQRKGKTTIITESPEKDRLLLKNMMDILRRKHPELTKKV